MKSVIISDQSTVSDVDLDTFLIDTHCHIHDAAFSEKFHGVTAKDMIEAAKAANVQQFICIGTDVSSSEQALAFSAQYNDCFCSLALHPHEAEEKSLDELSAQMTKLRKLSFTRPNKIIAIGECGLDYYYHADLDVRNKQKQLLRWHIDLAKKLDLPMIFHIRDAFEDFFKIFDSYSDIRGVVHSFSATEQVLQGVLERGLLVGLNGIMTFTKNQAQLAAAKSAPLEKIIIETDAPFLTPAPYRGKMCEPKHAATTAAFLSKLRGESLAEFTRQTTKNAQQLFGI